MEAPSFYWAVVLVLGSTSFIVYKAKQGLANGKIVGSDHWKTCLTKRDLFKPYRHIDFSTLDEKSNGLARVYTKGIPSATITAVFGRC